MVAALTVGFTSHRLVGGDRVPSPVLEGPAKEVSATDPTSVNDVAMEQEVVLDPKPLLAGTDASVTGSASYSEAPLGLSQDLMEKMFPPGDCVV